MKKAVNKTEKTDISLMDYLHEDVQCSPQFKPKSIQIDFDNKKVFMDGIEYGKIVEIRRTKTPISLDLTLRVSIVLGNKYLNGQEVSINWTEEYEKAL